MAEQHPDHKHETRDVPLRPFAIFIVVMLVGAVLMHVGLAVLSKVFHEVNTGIHGMPAPIAIDFNEQPSPQLLLSDELITRLHAHEAEELSVYKWADEKAGFVAIPIEQAMDIVARRGPPDWRNETDFRYW